MSAALHEEATPRLAGWVRLLARAIGAPVAEVRVLVAAFAVDARRRRELQATSDVPPGAIAVLLGFYLALSGCGLATLAWKLAPFPGIAGLVLSSIHLVLLVSLLLSELYGVLLSDDGFRVIASWPVRSACFFLARLVTTTRRALALTLLVLTPSALVLAARAPMKVLPGVAFLGASLVAAMIVTWAVAALYALLVRPLGVARLRVLGVLFQVAGLIGPMLGSALLGKRIDVLTQALTVPPLWWPASWVAAPVELSAGLPASLAWARFGIGVFAALALPVIALRGGAAVYAAGLASARVHGGRASLLAWASVLARAYGRPATRVVTTLLVAHARGDWRFRAQALLVPAMTLGLAVTASFGVDVRRAFADPLVRDGWAHPAMIFIALALVLPLLAVPVMMRSSDHGAAWLMRSGVLDPDDLARASRGVLRAIFVVPLLVAAFAGYKLFGIGWPSVLAHVVTLGLLAELALRGGQRLIAGLPFSRPPNDESIERTVAAMLMLTWSLCLLVAGLVVHLVYRHWLAIVAFDAYLLLMLRVLAQRETSQPALAAAATESA